MDTNTLRRWATPLTIGAFLLMAVTGVLMFFEIRLGLVKFAHEWLGWIMLLAVGLHAALHWKSFSRYFSQKSAVTIIAVFAVVTVAAMLIPSNEQGRSGRPGGMQAAQVLMSAPLEQVAGITGTTVEGLRAQLLGSGLEVAETATSLEDIAKQNQRNPIDVLNGVIGGK
ncbi:MAG: DUF4405 domain-containing protein [Thiothrix sp.]|uniref:DUF4405 domain-containing protein n=1 Tax=Thiothrix sp. TaxID=1032 RepID=UPI002636163F|nr:DUF4405 domain-containing protein [Thiothrix sp.]MDD5393827.1 DUF4405 domain-containing protein [Thiothrix sp.]